MIKFCYLGVLIKNKVRVSSRLSAFQGTGEVRHLMAERRKLKVESSVESNREWSRVHWSIKESSGVKQSQVELGEVELS